MGDSRNKHQTNSSKKDAERAHVSGVSPYNFCHRFGYCMDQFVSVRRLAQLMGLDSLDTTLIDVQGTKHELQHAAKTIAWR